MNIKLALYKWCRKHRENIENMVPNGIQKSTKKTVSKSRVNRTNSTFASWVTTALIESFFLMMWCRIFFFQYKNRFDSLQSKSTKLFAIEKTLYFQFIAKLYLEKLEQRLDDVVPSWVDDLNEFTSRFWS